MTLVSRLVRDSVAIAVDVMNSAENLRGLKDHLDDVLIAVHDGGERRGVMQVEDIHLSHLCGQSRER